MIRATGTIITVLLLLLVSVTICVAQRELYALGQGYVLQQAESIAARATLTADPRATTELLRDTVGRGNVLAGELLSSSGRTFVKLESPKAGLSRCHFMTGAALAESFSRAWTVGRTWCTSVPVFARRPEGLCRSSACISGRLHLIDSTGPVRNVVIHLTATILLSGLVVLSLALLSLCYVSERISSPLRQLAHVMVRFSAGDRAARSPEIGPEETRAISRVYNALIGQQEEHARLLEERVAQRTKDLRAATLAAQKAERDRTVFMARISHEMRTPLHVIQAQAGEVLHELEFWREGARARSHASLILQGSAELAYRVDQVLELARSRDTRQPLRLESISLQRVKEYLLKKFEHLAAKNGSALVVSASDAFVESDQDKLLQVLSNLIDNACKHTENGRIEVLISNVGGALQLSVADTGSGMQPEVLADIRNECRESEFSERRAADGFGLGLSIVRAHVAALHGTCHFDSVPGRGTIVSVSLPVKVPMSDGIELN